MARPQKLAYNTLDVFTTTAFTGNPLGLIHVPHATPLTQDQKQKLAIEFNYTETVILHESKPDSQPGMYDAQIFTPKSELPFAGHPIIGTAVWIFENLERERDEVVINLRAGQVHVGFERESGVASASIPHAVRIHGKAVGWERVGESQPGLAMPAGTESKLTDSKTPIVSIVPRMNFALVDLTAQKELLEYVNVTNDDIAKSQDLDEGWQEGLVGNVFYHILPAISDDEEDMIRVKQRVMVIGLEDPATGSACCALAAYLALIRGGVGRRYKFEIEQGTEMGRTSRIFVEVKLKNDGKTIKNVVLSGQAVEVMEGKVRI